MRLVVAEKPSVARDLAAVMDPQARRGAGALFGTSTTWTWATGHLAELLPPEAYRPELQGGWRLDLLPVLPESFRLRPRDGRSDQLEVIRGLLADAAEVVVATDAGREGELIWAYIAELCAWAGPTRRLWLSEATPAAVRAAFDALRDPMTDLAAAARARAQADWVVGMNATMALSARHGGLWSAGRVQTPTLALLCAREAEIRAFVPDDYFTITATFETPARARYTGRWFRAATEAAGPEPPTEAAEGQAGQARPQDRLGGRAEAEAIAARVLGQSGSVTSVQRRRTPEAPPRLFHLTDLQRAANARFGLTAAATLAAAQTLYERHKAITYPRTDSRQVSSETFGTFPARLRAIRGPLAPLAAGLAADLPHPGTRVVDDKAVSDHHAILPTAQVIALERLGPDEAKVLELVTRRFLAALLPPALYDDTEAITTVAGETFRSRSRTLASPGWRAAEPRAAEGPAAKGAGARGAKARRTGAGEGPGAEADQEAEPDAGDLSGLEAGLPSRCRTADVNARQTKAPARYSEATLLAAMEHAGRLVDDEALAEAMAARGLGTPATRAAIIETLIRRDYILREKRALVPTPRGERLVALAPIELRQPETTGDWERRLRDIEAGQAEAGDFLQGISALTVRIVADIAAQKRSAPVPAAKDVVGVCPRCGGHVVESQRAFGCANWRPEAGGCRWVLWKRLAGKELTAGQARELLAAGETKRAVKGFVAQSGTKFEARLRLDRASGRVSFIFAPGGAPEAGPRAPAARTGSAAPPRDRPATARSRAGAAKSAAQPRRSAASGAGRPAAPAAPVPRAAPMGPGLVRPTPGPAPAPAPAGPLPGTAAGRARPGTPRVRRTGRPPAPDLPAPPRP